MCSTPGRAGYGHEDQALEIVVIIVVADDHIVEIIIVIVQEDAGVVIILVVQVGLAFGEAVQVFVHGRGLGLLGRGGDVVILLVLAQINGLLVQLGLVVFGLVFVLISLDGVFDVLVLVFVLNLFLGLRLRAGGLFRGVLAITSSKYATGYSLPVKGDTIGSLPRS